MIGMKQALHCYGRYAFARYCARIGIPFEDCYACIFGKEPRK